MNARKVVGAHPPEIQIKQNEIHLDAGMMAGRISMFVQQRTERGNVLGRFQCVKIVGTLAQIDPLRAKLLPPLLITHSNSPPIVALKQNERTIEVKPFNGQEIPALFPKFPCDVQASSL